MRVMFVIDSLVTGGAEILLCSVANSLAREEGVTVAVVCLFPQMDEIRRLDQDRIRVTSLGLGGKYQLFQGRKRLAKEIDEFDPDIIHVHLFPADVVAALASRSRAFRRRPRSLLFSEHSGWNRRRNWKLFQLLDRWTYGHYDRVLCVSDRVRQTLLEWVPQLDAKATVLPNAIAIPPCQWSPPEPFQTDVLFVGRLDPAKGVDTLIRAIAALRKQGRELRTSIVGDGPLMATLRAVASEEGVTDLIDFCGLQTNIQERMMSARLLAIPSNWEGMSMVLLESMALGMPIVGTRVSGTEDLIDDGSSGLLVPPGDPQALASGIARLLDDPALAETLGQRARKYVEGKHTIGRYAVQLKELYRREMQLAEEARG